MRKWSWTASWSRAVSPTICRHSTARPSSCSRTTARVVEESTMKRVILALAAAAPLALAAENSPDTSFYRALAEGGMSEVDLAKLAEQKTEDPKIKDFAAMMVQDHSAANEKLASLASAKRVPIPRTLGASEMGARSRLEGL